MTEICLSCPPNEDEGGGVDDVGGDVGGNIMGDGGGDVGFNVRGDGKFGIVLHSTSLVSNS